MTRRTPIRRASQLMAATIAFALALFASADRSVARTDRAPPPAQGSAS